MKKIALVLFALMAIYGGIAKASPLTPNGAILDQAAGGGLSASFANASNAELYADNMLMSLASQTAFRGVFPSVRSENTFWLIPTYTKQNRDRDDYLGFNFKSTSIAAGLSLINSNNSLLGVAIGYDSRSLEMKEYAIDDDGDAFHLAIYGGKNFGEIFLDGYLGYSYTSHNSTRISVNSTNSGTYTAKGDYSDHIISGGLKFGYSLALGANLYLTPSVGLDVSYIKQESFDETGSAMETLKNISGDYTSLRIPVMLNLRGGAMALAPGLIIAPGGTIGYVHQAGDDNIKVNATSGINGGTKFTSKSAINDSYGIAGIGISAMFLGGGRLNISYNIAFTGDYYTDSIGLSYGIAF